MTILDELGAGFCRHALMMLIQSSILIAVLLAVDLLLRRRVRAVIRYSIWMLVFVKLILPATLCLPTGAGYWLGDYLSAGLGAARPDSVGSESGRMSVSAFVIPGGSYTAPSYESAYEPAILGADGSASPGISREAVIFLVWVVGVLVLSMLLVQRIWFVRGLVAQSEPVKGGLADKLNVCRRQMEIRRSVELRISQAALSPATCGLLRPKILLPASMLARLSAEKLRTVLIHELAHIKRGDLWVNFTQNILQVVYFYNPLLWLANAVVRRIREQAVDEMVLASLGDQAESYSKTLIDIAEMAFLRPSLGLRLIGVVESRKALAGRIRHITTRPFPKTARLGIRGLTAVLIIAAVLLPMAKAENEHAEELTHPENRQRDTAERHPDEPIGKDPREEIPFLIALRDRTHVSVLLQIEFQDELKVTCAEVEAKVESDPALDYDRAKTILEYEKLQQLEDVLYEQLCTERRLNEHRENLQTVVEAHQRLLYSPQEPRSVYWIMHRQIKQELTQQEKDTVLATYEGGQVTLEDWFETVNEIAPPKRPKDLDTIEGVERLLDEAIRTSIFVVEAESRGLEIDEKTKWVTDESLTSRPVTRVYDISGLVGAPDGEVEDRFEDVQNLMTLIVETIEPDSWYVTGTGEGAITSYQDEKLIILQTPLIHRKIEKLLSKMRTALLPQITVEARFVTVSDEFLDSMGADGNSLCDIQVARHGFNSASEALPKPFKVEFEGEGTNAPVGESGSGAISKSSACMLDDLQVYFLLGAVRAHKDAKVLASPKVLVLAGERAEVRIEGESAYISGYVEPNSPSGRPEPKYEHTPVGMKLQVLPKLTDDSMNIKLDIDFEISRVIGFEEHLYKGQYAYQVPTMEVVSSSARVIMPDGATVLISGKKLTAENEDGQRVEKNLLVLIKAQKVEPQQGNSEPSGTRRRSEYQLE
jgi:beta-lactamase regulating signal transducer with metallopeptidase domain